QEFDDVKYADGSTGKVWHQILSRPLQINANGIALKLSAGDPYIAIRGASQAKGKVRGQDFAIYDCNGNGLFNDFGFDCVVTGSGKTQRVQPLSKYILIGDLLYELRVDPNGKAV